MTKTAIDVISEAIHKARAVEMRDDDGGRGRRSYYVQNYPADAAKLLIADLADAGFVIVPKATDDMLAAAKAADVELTKLATLRSARGLADDPATLKARDDLRAAIRKIEPGYRP